MIVRTAIAFTAAFVLFQSELSTIQAAGIDSLVLTATINGEATGDQMGIAVGSAGDVNGDGYKDVLIGASANDQGGSAAGKAYLFLGSALLDNLPDWTHSGGTSGDFLGAAVAGVGDVNGDGYDDFVIGAPFASHLGLKTGMAMLFLGGTSISTAPDLVFYGEGNLDQFGSTIAGLGDINHDGYGDWAIGAFKADSGSQADIGKAYIYFGGATPDSAADLIIIGKANGERFGFAIAGLGHFNNDLYDDYAVGAYSYDDTQVNRGRVYVFLGGSAPDTVADLILTGAAGFDFFGFSVANAGDVNNDGYDDLLVGAKGVDYGSFTDVGKVYLYHGGTVLDTTADYSYGPHNNNDDEFSTSVASGRNLNGDGYAEFLVGADYDKSGGTDAGKAYLFGGNAAPPYPLDRTIEGPGSGALFGCALSGLGRVQNHSFGSFVVGAWAYANATGAAYVYASLDTASVPCSCPCQYDPRCDGIISDILDVSDTINRAFRGASPTQDPECPFERTDVDASGATDILDVTKTINVAFRGNSAGSQYNLNFCP